MNIKDLKKILREKSPRRINIVGNEQILIKEALQAIKDFYVDKDYEDFDYSYITDESDNEILILIRELPMSKMKLIILPEKAERFASSAPSSTCIVSLDNSIKEPDLEVDCKKLWGRNLTNYIKQRSKELGLDFDAQDVHKFMNYVGNDLTVINNELFKLSFLENKNRSTIEQLEEGNINSKLDSFLVAFATKNSSLALQTLYDLQNYGSPQLKIFGFLVYVCKTLLKNLFLDEEDPQADRKYQKHKTSFDFKSLTQIILRLERIDLSVKLGIVDLSVPLKYLVERNYSSFDSFINKALS